MRIILITLFALFTLSSFSQDNDDIYWTIYDVDTVEEETNTYVTNNYYTDYTSRINRFHRHPYYTSYWSYHNPYWYSYYYPFYTSYYWWWGYNSWSYYGWYSPYRNWYSHYNYSHYSRPTYYYAYNHHHHNSYKKSNTNKKQIVSKHKKINMPVYKTYSKPKYNVKTPIYTKPVSVKYVHVETNTSKRPTKKFNLHPTVPTKPNPDRHKISSPSRVTSPPRRVKIHPSKIQHIKKDQR